jgi:muramoyltetrapeptide carboxypeptidase
MSLRLAPLPAGSLLAVIAPAGPPQPAQLAQVAGLVEALGFRARLYPGCAGPSPLPHLAASDAQRLADLHAALADPEVDALLCLRGGYGCLRLLPGLDRQLIAGARTPLIGYSDITSLHAVWAQLGIPAWHAPMPSSDWLQPGGLADAEHLARALQRGVHAGDVLTAPAPHPLSRGGRARGRLLGGNLAVLASCLGTPAMPSLAGAILFLEEIGEDPYRVDRYLAQLKYAAAFDGLAGLLLGSFSGADSADAVLADHLHALGLPLLAGWPAGHGQPNRALPLGLAVELEVAERSLRW